MHYDYKDLKGGMHLMEIHATYFDKPPQRERYGLSHYLVQAIRYGYDFYMTDDYLGSPCDDPIEFPNISFQDKDFYSPNQVPHKERGDTTKLELITSTVTFVSSLGDRRLLVETILFQHLR